MRRTKELRGRKSHRPPKLRVQDHWRTLASTSFQEHKELISSEDEEFGVYNLFFQLRDQLAEAVSHRDAETAIRILDFAGRCLEKQLASDGEDISVAAGVALFEHVFEDVPAKEWAGIFSAMRRTVFLACRPWVMNWMEPEAFSNVDEAAKQYYG